MKRFRATSLIASILTCVLCMGIEWGEWSAWGDLHDGTYRNPIIPSDYSDLDCIKVGDDYYAISSTFQFSPGMTILHSQDLVNWEILGGAGSDLTQIGPELGYEIMDKYARGIWAGSIHHHNGKYFIYFGTPDEGYFMTSAPAPEGPWESLTCIMAEKGWDDCCAFWDEMTGKAWFVGTHFADEYKTYIFPMSIDGKSIDHSKARLINEGSYREANKLWHKDDYYYLIFSEHTPGIGRYVMAKRTKDLEQGFSEERQLALASADAREPNQGAILLGPDNKYYFFTHHGTGDWSGRIASLLPVTWLDDWPIIGEIQKNEEDKAIGSMCWNGKMPMIDNNANGYSLQRSDDFDSPVLSPQWQWNYQPRETHYSLTERQGWLRLKAFIPLQPDKLLTAGNTLTTRTFRTTENTVTIKMDISCMSNGQQCGLCHFSAKNSSIGVSQNNQERRIIFRENEAIVTGPVLDKDFIWLRSEWDLDGLSQYSYSLDGDNFIPFGQYQLSWGNYRGDRIGIYCYNNLSETGFVDIDYLLYSLK